MAFRLQKRIGNISTNSMHSSQSFIVDEVVGADSRSLRAEIVREWGDPGDPQLVEIEVDGQLVLASCACHAAGGRLDCVHVCAALDYLDWTDFPWPSGPLTLAPRDQTHAWKAAFSTAQLTARPPLGDAGAQQIEYVLDIEGSVQYGQLIMHVQSRRPLKRGGWSKPKQFRSLSSVGTRSMSVADRDVIDLLRSFQNHYYSGYYGGGEKIPAAATQTVLKAASKTGRLYWRLNDEDEQRPLAWQDDLWSVRLGVEPSGEEDGWDITGAFVCGDRSRPLQEAVIVTNRGEVLFEDEAAAFDTAAGGYGWATTIRARGKVFVPKQDTEELMRTLAASGALQLFELPEELQYERIPGTPRPRARVGRPQRGSRTLPVDVEFLYGEDDTPATAGAGAVDHQRRQIILRDQQQEERHWEQAQEAGVRPAAQPEIHADQLPKAVGLLVTHGWQVEADGKLLRKPGTVQIAVTSGVDWFDLEGKFDFDGQQVSFPKVLSALRRGDKYVPLGDGSQGLLPEQWLEKFGDVAGLGEADGDLLRFSMPQAVLLDALLEAQDDVQLDAKYRAYREKLRGFGGVEAAEPPAAFRGELRQYQKDGLGWLKFLREFQLGGCLADDMGLGKTIQVLALLQAERSRRLKKDEQRLPSLIVVPRSLLFNWAAEAEKFTPRLKVMQYFGLQRKELLEQWDEQDVIVTTYGIVRRDIQILKDKSFHFVVLDEAQAIKNDKSLSAKSCRLLSARHRLGLTGTPVENHLGELWSLFEFLNPGLLGRNEAFLGLARRAKDDSAAREMIARGIRPFVLRRTKQQVLTDLPEKSEQTIVCEMDAKQRKLYDELRDYYRVLLSKKVADQGLKRSKIHVLEALLRLRQCACDPRLIDPLSKVPSAKVNSLLETLEELADEGHKALVFSQFTKLLGVVREQLDRRGIAYEYLDGRTRKRQQKVEAFQNNPDCPLFLISLKAGGHGLNLTAADYVFILDPWWNPAVEAQAVDRAHRIGQDKPVFAYRLICRDTVEEKILELQAEKRDLAEAIINADNSLLRDLTADDLAVLLS